MLSSDSPFVSSVLGLALIGLIFVKKDYLLELKDKLVGGEKARIKDAHGAVLKRKHSGTRASTVAWYERKHNSSEMPKSEDEKPEKSNLVQQNSDDVPKRKHSGSRASTVAYYERKRSNGESPHDLVVKSWAKVKGLNNYEAIAGEMLFRRIFEINPDATVFFSFASTSGEDIYKNELFHRHANAVISTVTAAVDLLKSGDMETLVAVLKDLGRRHSLKNLELEESHYDLVGQALLDTLGKALGGGFSPDVKEAWVGVYGVITEQMMLGASEHKEETEEEKRQEKSDRVVSNIVMHSYLAADKAAQDPKIAEQVANIVMNSFLATERAANEDPKISEQNRLISEQKKAWEVSQGIVSSEGNEPNETVETEENKEEEKAKEVTMTKTGNPVVDSWEIIKAIPNYETVAGELLFRRIFEINPDATDFFHFASSGSGDDIYKNELFHRHADAVISTVTAAVDLLKSDDMETLVTVLQDLGARHVRKSLDLEKAHYDLVGQALLDTLAKALGEAFSPEVKESWLGVYGVITEHMMLGALEEKTKSEEEKKGDEAHRVVADIVMASYLATERAAVLDPKIAEQNRRIAEQKKAWEEAQQK